MSPWGSRRRMRASRKLRVLAHAEENGNVSRTCRYFGVSRDTFYRWKRDYKRLGDEVEHRKESNFICLENLSEISY